MRQASKRIPESAEKTVRDIRRATRRHHSAEEKIRIVLEGLRGEDSIAELCRKEGINQNLYYRWSKEFLEVGKKRLAGDTAREATSDEVKERLFHQFDDLELLGCGISHEASSPSPRTLFLSRRFSIRTSARVSLSWRASALSSLTSSEVASRAVSPASRFLPASRNSFDQR